ncbi:hypothetical protein SDC9_91345 [bioreactor metagenome]|uniref:Uncharacterized protein n=1 Tax=bioreactor metagenome TaxID=1076179 RepID=A0A644ZVD0_9ZZZZ
MPVEDAGPVLVADPQRVAEPAGDHQQRTLPGALQQRVGRHGGPHPHRLDLRGRHGHVGGRPEQGTDPGHRGVAVPGGVLRQQLVRHQATIGSTGHDVGERATPVDPELPPRTRHRESFHRARVEVPLCVGRGRGGRGRRPT